LWNNTILLVTVQNNNRVKKLKIKKQKEMGGAKGLQ
jgi:hypothetical protein